MNILITGGAGYIGSHFARLLSTTKHNFWVLDNLSTGHREAVRYSPLISGDIGNERLLTETIQKCNIEAIVHFAASSLVGESVERPDKYYNDNVCKGLKLLETAVRSGVSYFIFSSTAAVYGEPEETPITEEHPANPQNPYGESKLFFETMLKRFSQRYGLRSVSLRYFNAAGAAEGGEIGEKHEPETHLIPLLLDYVRGARSEFKIFGTDYPTPDGTPIRDFIHVEDLARAHLLALEALPEKELSPVYNLGSGIGFSVLEVLRTAEKILDKRIHYEQAPRRLGDPSVLVAGSEKIKKELGWEPYRSDLETIISSAWAWQKKL